MSSLPKPNKLFEKNSTRHAAPARWVAEGQGIAFVANTGTVLTDAPRHYEALQDYFRSRPGLDAIEFRATDQTNVLVTREDVGLVADEEEEQEEAAPKKHTRPSAETRDKAAEEETKEDASTQAKTK